MRLILVGYVGLALLLRFLFGPSVASNIVDFHPTEFRARADTGFFSQSAGNSKYSNEINPQALTLLRGRIDNFLVSPDRERIAVVANGMLLVVSAHATGVRQVVSVDSIYKQPKPIGGSFFRDDDFQWADDSGHLYLIKDEY